MTESGQPASGIAVRLLLDNGVYATESSQSGAFSFVHLFPQRTYVVCVNGVSRERCTEVEGPNSTHVNLVVREAPPNYPMQPTRGRSLDRG